MLMTGNETQTKEKTMSFDDFDTELQVEDRYDDIAEQENAEDWAAEMAAEDAREANDSFARWAEWDESALFCDNDE
jgi:inosine/xanthosine triphosphate pyrophosphatase family protein